MSNAVSELTQVRGGESRRAVANLGGKYLTFRLDNEEYGLEILKVREIIGMMDITAVPRTPEFVRGVINLRGNVIPVIDLRLRFMMPPAEQTDETCIIVVDVEGVEMGIVVDRVSEVLDIADEEIQEAPSFGVAVDTDFILGIGKVAARVAILLNISEVLTTEDLAGLQALSGPGESSDSDEL
jgi:purine-binding chemotaxis protein CheW